MNLAERMKAAKVTQRIEDKPYYLGLVLYARLLGNPQVWKSQHHKQFKFQFMNDYLPEVNRGPSKAKRKPLPHHRCISCGTVYPVIYDARPVIHNCVNCPDRDSFSWMKYHSIVSDINYIGACLNEAQWEVVYAEYVRRYC